MISAITGAGIADARFVGCGEFPIIGESKK
jgi:hypothetical protein